MNIFTHKVCPQNYFLNKPLFETADSNKLKIPDKYYKLSIVLRISFAVPYFM